VIYRGELRSRFHSSDQSTFFRENFVKGFDVTSPSLEGKVCVEGCKHVYGANAGEGHVYKHVTSAKAGDRSVHELNVFAANESSQRGISGFFVSTTSTVRGGATERRLLVEAENTSLSHEAAAAVPVVVGDDHAPVTSRSPCLGYRPHQFSSFHAQYPWLLHTVASVGWNASTENGGSLFNLSPPCEGVVSSLRSQTCNACAQLEFSPKLAAIVKTATDPLSPTSTMNG
jgi:hypothetical protein